MNVHEIKEILRADMICGDPDIDLDFKTACGSDMMSDVLAFVKDQAMLLTGLVNPQVVRTCEMMDIRCIVFVRGMTPDEQVIRLANDKDLILMKTPYRMFTACGLLYLNGLPGGCENE